MTDLLISDFTDARFQKAFQLYFEELGIHVKDWDGLFREMNEDGNWAYLRMTEDGSVVGFIQFKPIALTNWFFEEKAGFIREFWIAEAHRGQGHGSALLGLAEAYFVSQGIHQTILTTDTAPEFSEKHGYRKNPCIQAKNNDDVYIKKLPA